MKRGYTLAGLAGAAAVGVASIASPSAAQAPAAGAFTAVLAEVRDAAGQTVLRGTFVADEDDNDDDELEWEARLEPTGVDPDASGTAEVEVPRAETGAQDIEFSVRGVEPGARFVFLIDGREVGSAVADRRGRVELEQKPGETRR